MELSRRGFIAGIFAMPAVIKIESLMPVKSLPNIIGETEFGFTLGNLSSFDEIIRETLRNKSKYIAANITQNNNLLFRIKGNKYVKVNYIDPQVQTNRMIARLFPTGKKDLWLAKEETKEEALKREQLYYENRDKWDNKFLWYQGYENIGEKIFKEQLK